MPRDPLEGDDGLGIHDAALVEQRHRVIHRQHRYPDVLAFRGQTVQAADPFAVHAPAEQAHRLGGCSRAREKRRDGNEVGDDAARLFQRFAPGQVFRRLSGLDDPGHAFEEPRIPVRSPRPRTKLLDEHHSVTHGIHRKDRGDLASFENLAREHRSEAAGELPVAQAIAVEAEKAVMHDFPVYQLDVVSICHVRVVIAAQARCLRSMTCPRTNDTRTSAGRACAVVARMCTCRHTSRSGPIRPQSDSTPANMRCGRIRSGGVRFAPARRSVIRSSGRFASSSRARLVRSRHRGCDACASILPPHRVTP